MTRKRFSAGLLVALMTSGTTITHASIPEVAMTVTTPDGRTQDLTAPESSVARLTLNDGTEYEFRPTIQDSSPWNRITVTIFKGATSTTPVTPLAEVEVRRGGPPVDSKTSPAFKIAVTNVSAPTEGDSSDTR
jgi:hypothetical protein